MRVAALLLLIASAASAQTPTPKPFAAGKPLGVEANGTVTPMSRNVRVHGAVVNAESCSFDTTRNLIVVPSRGALQNEVPNDGFVSLINLDGSVHTAKWIGATRDGLVLNHPFGSDIVRGTLFLADYDGGTVEVPARTAIVRTFDMANGQPTGGLPVPKSPGLNDIAVTNDGVVFATQTGNAEGTIPMRVYRITPGQPAEVLVEGGPLARPNGIALDPDGNIVVANMGDARILTLSRDGKLMKTEQAAQVGSDGLVIMSDGTKYVSSVINGGVSRIRPGRAAELIATGIPTAASMCLDPRNRQLVIPMNANNALAFIKL